jgi:hypothetical protein
VSALAREIILDALKTENCRPVHSKDESAILSF